MVHGAPLMVPGDFVSTHNTQSNYNSQLQQLHILVPIPTSQHGVAPASIPHTLQQAKFVFIRCDTHRTPLQPLTKAPSRSFNQVAKRLRLTLEGRLKQFQSTDLSLHTLIWKNQSKLYNPDPEDDQRSLKQNIHPFRSQARPTLLYHGVPDRAIKSTATLLHLCV